MTGSSLAGGVPWRNWDWRMTWFPRGETARNQVAGGTVIVRGEVEVAAVAVADVRVVKVGCQLLYHLTKPPNTLNRVKGCTRLGVF